MPNYLSAEVSDETVHRDALEMLGLLKENHKHRYVEDCSSDCLNGCGAYMCNSSSGAPKGIDPFGDCPNWERNPVILRQPLDDNLVRQLRAKMTDEQWDDYHHILLVEMQDKEYSVFNEVENFRMALEASPEDHIRAAMAALTKERKD